MISTSPGNCPKGLPCEFKNDQSHIAEEKATRESRQYVQSTYISHKKTRNFYWKAYVDTAKTSQNTMLHTARIHMSNANVFCSIDAQWRTHSIFALLIPFTAKPPDYCWPVTGYTTQRASYVERDFMRCYPHVVVRTFVLVGPSNDMSWVLLTHWGRETHICVGKLTIIASDNGLSPDRRQAIIWTNTRLLLIGPLGTNFGEILIGIPIFSLKKIRLKMSSAKCCSFRLGLNVLTSLIPCLYSQLSYMDSNESDGTQSPGLPYVKYI